MADPIVQNLPATPDNLGQKTSAESVPVVLPSDYSLPVDTTGLATEAKQDTLIAEVDAVEESLTSIEGKLDTANGHIDGIESELTTLNAKDFATELSLSIVSDYLAHRLSGSLVPGIFDTIVPTFNASSDEYAYKIGGVSGSIVRTVTITYTDTTKAAIQSVVSA